MSNSFVRKIIYILLIAVLLIPLSMISRPAVRSQSPGGVLARLKTDYDLSQAELSEIDPASQTMKLASLGLRGVAVNMLWMQAIEHRKKENYEALASTLKAITKLQPNFVKVWEYQSHNLAYNVSAEFDDYEYRYQWVKKGIDFLKDGVRYNIKDHRMTDTLGFTTGNKMGKSDEKLSFRRLFRKDDAFHQSLSDMVDPESYDVDEYGPDSWLLADQWYGLSHDMVAKGARKYRNDVIFYHYKPSQVRNRGLSLQNEHRTDDLIQDVWVKADRAWKAYGERELLNGIGVLFRMGEGRRRREELRELRLELDELVPGAREQFLREHESELSLTDQERQLLNLSSDQRTDMQETEARDLIERLQLYGSTEIDTYVAERAPKDQQVAAQRLARNIVEIANLMASESRDAGTVNYDFWADRNEAEARDLTVSARKALYDARQMRRRSIYDDEYDIDYVTKERQNTRKGAISLYNDAFAQWSEVFRLYPALVESPLSDEIAGEIKLYFAMLRDSNTDWPFDFPLQWFVDERHENGEPDDFPTSSELEEYRSGKTEAVVEPKSEPLGSESKQEADAEKRQPTEEEASANENPTDENPANEPAGTDQ